MGCGNSVTFLGPARLDGKLHPYPKAGVQKYGVVDPLTQYVRVLVLHNGQYGENAVYERNETVKVTVFDDVEVPLSEVFLDDIT